MDFELTYFNDQGHVDPLGLNFLGLHWIEVQTSIKEAYLRANGDNGAASFTGYFDAAAGKGINNTGKCWIGVKDAKDFWQIPNGTRQVRVSGRRDSPATLVSFGILPVVA